MTTTLFLSGALLILALGCTRTPAETVERQKCIALAEGKAEVRSDAECFAPAVVRYESCLNEAKRDERKLRACDTEFDGYWDQCPARAEIMSELQRSQEKCR